MLLRQPGSVNVLTPIIAVYVNYLEPVLISLVSLYFAFSPRFPLARVASLEIKPCLWLAVLIIIRNVHMYRKTMPLRLTISGHFKNSSFKLSNCSQ